MTPLFAIGMPGGQEWFWIFLAVVLLFGARKLPELARGLGRSLAEFRKAKDEFDREMNRAADEIEDSKKSVSASSKEPQKTESKS